MALPDKIEAVQKTMETQGMQPMTPVEEIDQMSSNKEHFQSLINSTQPINKANSFERVGGKVFAFEEAQSKETQPVFAEENVSVQKSGTATDQDRKQGRQSQSEEVEGISATGSKQTSDTSKSLMDQVGTINTNISEMSKLSPEAIKTQVTNVMTQLDQVKQQLSQAQSEIKPSYQTLLRNRLTHIDDNLKIALSKAGVEYTPPPTLSKTESSNPIKRFINMVSNSQHQLENMHTTIDQLNASGNPISAVQMLTIQIKMGYVQQQIELFTSLLNKALESTKTLMNVQV